MQRLLYRHRNRSDGHLIPREVIPIEPAAAPRQERTQAGLIAARSRGYKLTRADAK